MCRDLYLQERTLIFADSFLFSPMLGLRHTMLATLSGLVSISICRVLGGPLLVTSTLKGLRAEHLRLHGGPAHANALLTDDWVAQVACLADSKDLLRVQAASVLSSVFLMRVQSETL